MLARPLLRGTLALTAAGLYSRLTGSASRIILVRLVGETGIGLFQMVVPVVNLAITVALLGLPGAMAQMVAKAEARRAHPEALAVRRRTTLLLAVAATLAAVALWALAPFLANHVLTDPRTEPALRLAPSSWPPPSQAPTCALRPGDAPAQAGSVGPGRRANGARGSHVRPRRPAPAAGHGPRDRGAGGRPRRG